jgi:hypothetical protein
VAICIGQAADTVRGDMVGKIEKMLSEVDLSEAANAERAQTQTDGGEQA